MKQFSLSQDMLQKLLSNEGESNPVGWPLNDDSNNAFS